MRRYLIAAVVALLVGMFVFPGLALGTPQPKVDLCHADGNGVDENCDPIIPEPVLAAVLDRGALRCGVSGGTPGFSLEVAPGVFEGFDVDMCRVVAAAVLGDADAVDFIPLSGPERFPALQDGFVDVLMRTTTETLGRDALASNGGVGVNFGPTTFYDGQGILVDTTSPGLGAVTPDSTIADLPNGTSVCVPPDSSLEFNLLAAAADAGKTFTLVPVPNPFVAIGVFINGGCDVVTVDRTRLALVRADAVATGIPGAADWVVLKQMISKEPLAPVVADGDDEWMAVVDWSVNAVIFAEEVGITSANIDVLDLEASIEISLAFGTLAENTGALLGLDADWAYQAIKQVGNYGEIYAANLELIGLAREGTLNESYVDGGLLYAPPIR